MTGPPSWSPPPGWQPTQPPAAPPKRPARPVDVDTGFWLWLVALPVMTTGYVVNLLSSPAVARTGALYPAVVLIAVVLCAVVVTFLVLMRSGYRWARTVLTGGGVAAVVYAITALFDADVKPVIAVTSAVTGIVGSVLIAGGTFLLHRSDAQGYFIR
ncbi:MAG TPA: hypothetical protein VFQ37_12440 [Mycobacterium sp.]|nr:hypothetical protein [Mycobacterium sp.]